MTTQTEYIKYVNSVLKPELISLVEDCFSFKSDPEVSWKTFREQLRHLKKEQVELYMEMDDE